MPISLASRREHDGFHSMIAAFCKISLFVTQILLSAPLIAIHRGSLEIVNKLIGRGAKIDHAFPAPALSRGKALQDEIYR